MGAVAYDPKVVTIWDGFRAWFAEQGFAFDYVLYSNYERQVEELLAGRIHAAWNSPLAWVRAARLAAARGQAVQALVMRDTDCDLTSVVVVRRDGRDRAPRRAARAGGGGRRGRLAAGHPAPPGAPARRRARARGRLRRSGASTSASACTATTSAASARRRGRWSAGEVDAACMIDGNHLLFTRRARCPPGSTRILGPDRAVRPLQHDHRPRPRRRGWLERFGDAAAGDVLRRPAVRPLLDLEGLKAWRAGAHDRLRGARGGRRRRRLLRRGGPCHRRRLSTLRTSGFDRGAHLLLDRALRRPARGRAPRRPGRDPRSACTCAAWCRARGPPARVDAPARGPSAVAVVVRGRADDARWHGAERAGGAAPGEVATRAAASWGLAARGALVEAGGPGAALRPGREGRGLGRPAPRLYAQAAAGQWDPATRSTGTPPFDLPPDVEAAVVQVMTYLVENEQAALIVPARFLGRIHPHFREVVQVLAVQVADEARHVEVFTRRAASAGGPLGVSGAGGRASLGDPAGGARLRAGLVPALGARRGHLPEPAGVPRAPRARTRSPAGWRTSSCRTRRATSPSAWPTSSTRWQRSPDLRDRLRTAIERRHDALADTAGLKPRCVRRAGGARRRGLDAGGDRRAATPPVEALQGEMDEGRRRRLVRWASHPPKPPTLSALHTRNFMWGLPRLSRSPAPCSLGAGPASSGGSGREGAAPLRPRGWPGAERLTLGARATAARACGLTAPWGGRRRRLLGDDRQGVLAGGGVATEQDRYNLRQFYPTSVDTLRFRDRLYGLPHIAPPDLRALHQPGRARPGRRAAAGRGHVDARVPRGDAGRRLRPARVPEHGRPACGWATSTPCCARCSGRACPPPCPAPSRRWRGFPRAR